MTLEDKVRTEKRKRYINAALHSKTFREEYDALIEYRLGEDFPKERRDQLWKARRSLTWAPLWLCAGYIIHPFSERLQRYILKYKHEQVIREFRKVLNPEEMKALFQGDQDLFAEVSS